MNYLIDANLPHLLKAIVLFKEFQMALSNMHNTRYHKILLVCIMGLSYQSNYISLSISLIPNLSPHTYSKVKGARMTVIIAEPVQILTVWSTEAPQIR